MDNKHNTDDIRLKQIPPMLEPITMLSLTSNLFISFLWFQPLCVDGGRSGAKPTLWRWLKHGNAE